MFCESGVYPSLLKNCKTIHRYCFAKRMYSSSTLEIILVGNVRSLLKWIHYPVLAKCAHPDTRATPTSRIYCDSECHTRCPCCTRCQTKHFQARATLTWGTYCDPELLTGHRPYARVTSTSRRYHYWGCRARNHPYSWATFTSGTSCGPERHTWHYPYARETSMSRRSCW